MRSSCIAKINLIVKNASANSISSSELKAPNFIAENSPADLIPFGQSDASNVRWSVWDQLHKFNASGYSLPNITSLTEKARGLLPEIPNIPSIPKFVLPESVQCAMAILWKCFFILLIWLAVKCIPGAILFRSWINILFSLGAVWTLRDYIISYFERSKPLLLVFCAQVVVFVFFISSPFGPKKFKYYKKTPTSRLQFFIISSICIILSCLIPLKLGSIRNS